MSLRAGTPTGAQSVMQYPGSRTADSPAFQHLKAVLPLDGAPMLSCPGASEEPLQPSQSLWKMVEEHLAPSERLEVKAVLGNDVVERSLELHAEEQTLLDLCQELQSGNLRQEQSTTPAAESWALLAAPPNLKELVREEIRLLLMSLQQKALQEGRAQDGVIAKYSPHVVTFALKVNAGNSRPSSASTALIRPTPSRIPNDLGPIYNKLNIAQIGEVSSRLRTLLEDECNALERYISYLQCQLEEMHQHAKELLQTTHEPTMTELQEEKRAMEQDLQMGQTNPTSTFSLMSKQLAGSGSPFQISPKGLAKGTNLGEINPASNAASPSHPRDWTSPMCHQTPSWWSPSAKSNLEWEPLNTMEVSHGRKDNSTPLPTPLIPTPPKGNRTTPACRTAAPVWEPVFQPMPPADPCPPPRFCSRTRLLRCKGPS